MEPLVDKMRYIKLWLNFAKIRFLVNLQERWAALFFISGKFIRFIFVLGFIIKLSETIGIFHGYTQQQLIIIFLTFNLLDLVTQFLFRGIYLFRNAVLYGAFDRDLLYPANPLFLSLMTYIDALDLPLLLVSLLGLLYVAQGYNLSSYLTYISFIFNGLFIIAGLHFLVAAITIIYSTGDQIIHIYRDVSAMARFPINIYSQPVQVLLNTILPIGIAITLPAQVLFNQATLFQMFYGGIVSLLFVGLSLTSWRFALRRYSSASS